jgi:hypothetical protein
MIERHIVEHSRRSRYGKTVIDTNSPGAVPDDIEAK